MIRMNWYIRFKFSQNLFSQNKFDDLEYLRTDVKTALKKNNFIYLTNSQQSALSSFFKHPKNVLLAETGSGKTLAYSLPIVNHLYEFHHKFSMLQTEEEKNKML